MDKFSWQAAPFLEPGQQDALQSARLNHSEDAREGIMRGDAIGQCQEGAEEVEVVLCEGGNLNEVIAAGQGSTEAEEDDIEELVSEVLALPPRIGQRL
jgi:hypothetical protein